ncbi:MAG: TonB-dependent receptor [Acidobacteria bacterium]|nr:TonB-dependent receptor [Acidobacteriota bacterium]
MKFGADYRGPMRNICLDVPGLRGTWTFDGQRSGIGLADFLLGYPNGAQLSNVAVVDQRLWMLSWFAQDDWKVTPKLTLNLGLRYDFATWPYEGADRMTNFDPVARQTFTPANSSYGKSLIRSDKNNFAPRLGIAYQLTPNTVLRTGYGRFFMLFERAGSEDQLALNLPFFVNNVVGATSASQTANGMRVRTGFNLSLNPNAVNPCGKEGSINPMPQVGVAWAKGRRSIRNGYIMAPSFTSSHFPSLLTSTLSARIEPLWREPFTRTFSPTCSAKAVEGAMIA